MTDHSAAQRALGAIGDSGIEFVVTEHGPVRSLAEAADARGLTPDRVLKSIVVRRGEGDHLFVLVPGGRTISWPKLRGLLGVNRLSMPSAEDALEVTATRGERSPPSARRRTFRSSPTPRSQRDRCPSAEAHTVSRSQWIRQHWWLH